MKREKLSVPICLYRLLKKLPDESFKIVGYEIHRHCGESGIQIMHSFDNLGHDSLLRRFSNISAVWGTKDCYVEHDRKDIYTGTDIKGKKIYKNDRVKVSWLAELGITELDCEAVGTIKYVNCGFSVVFDNKYIEHVADEMDYEIDHLDISGLNSEILEESESFSLEIIGIEGVE